MTGSNLAAQWFNDVGNAVTDGTSFCKGGSIREDIPRKRCFLSSIAKIAFATHKARHGFSPPPSAQKVLSTLCLQEILNKNVLYEILWPPEKKV